MQRFYGTGAGFRALAFREGFGAGGGGIAQDEAHDAGLVVSALDDATDLQVLQLEGRGPFRGAAKLAQFLESRGRAVLLHEVIDMVPDAARRLAQFGQGEAGLAFRDGGILVHETLGNHSDPGPLTRRPGVRLGVAEQELNGAAGIGTPNHDKLTVEAVEMIDDRAEGAVAADGHGFVGGRDAPNIQEVIEHAPHIARAGGQVGHGQHREFFLKVGIGLHGRSSLAGARSIV